MLADTYGPYDLAIDGTYVYWTSLGQVANGAAINRVPKVGGAATTIATQAGGIDVNGPRGIAVDAGGVYWINYGTKTVMTCGISGPPCAKLTTSPAAPYNLSSNAGSLYWTVDTGGVYSTSKTLGGLATIAATSDPTCLDSDNQNVAFRVNGIELTDLMGGSPNVLTLGGCADIILDPTTVFWTHGDKVNAMPRAGGQMYLVASNQFDSYGVAFDQSYVYWIDYGPSVHYIKKAIKTGGGPVITLAQYPSMFQPRQALAVDGQAVYWIEDGAGHVLKVGK